MAIYWKQRLGRMSVKRPVGGLPGCDPIYSLRRLLV